MRRDDTDNDGASRSTRMYRDKEDWFFNTREKGAIGPFRDKLEASTQLEIYIRMADSGLLRSES